MRGKPDVHDKVKFNYVATGIKYYLLTDSSAYPSAEFHFPNVFTRGSDVLVVPEVKNNSAGPKVGAE